MDSSMMFEESTTDEYMSTSQHMELEYSNSLLKQDSILKDENSRRLQLQILLLQDDNDKLQRQVAIETERNTQLVTENERNTQLAIENERRAQRAIENERKAQLAIEDEGNTEHSTENEENTQLILEKERNIQLSIENERNAQLILEKERNIQKLTAESKRITRQLALEKEKNTRLQAIENERNVRKQSLGGPAPIIPDATERIVRKKSSGAPLPIIPDELEPTVRKKSSGAPAPIIPDELERNARKKSSGVPEPIIPHEPEPKKKKRKIFGAAKTIFDEEYNEADKRPTKISLAPTLAKPGGNLAFLRKSGVGTANAAFSPLKKDKKGGKTGFLGLKPPASFPIHSQSTGMDATGTTGSAKHQSLLEKSAHGATFLIALQIGSRALTFAANQIILRFISPDLLGISTQFEVYLISVLFFARESLRVAIQRQSELSEGPEEAIKSTQDGEKSERKRKLAIEKTQALVNLAYISICLGVFFASGLAWAYMRSLRSNPKVLGTLYFKETLQLYAIAAGFELLAEPCFVVVQQKSEYKTRAFAESIGALLRCVVTCASIIFASKTGLDLGVFPFALGQWTYGLSILLCYLWRVSAISAADKFSLLARPIAPRYVDCGFQTTLLLTRTSSNETYFMSYFSKPLVTLGASLFVQGVVKHILTEGDVLLISYLASLSAQGIYALASNYGGLVARMVFQPIEESSRNYFGKLLYSSNGQRSSVTIASAKDDLHKLLRIYTLMSISAMTVGPTMAPLLLKFVVGSRWASSGAGDVLSKYCYYIPLLAYNGVLEAFVSVVATESQLNRQSLWMLAFSVGFASTGYVFLRLLDLGAIGLVYANMANMVFRILWSYNFINSFFRRHNSQLNLALILPTATTVAAAMGTIAIFYHQNAQEGSEIKHFITTTVIGGSFFILL
ncbi:Oligosaccharide translocation protein rft1 [Pseudogymnoascus australis]